MSLTLNSGMILAAGYGKRLRPYTEACPKPLVKVAGQPIIDYAYDHLKAAGVDKIVVNTHYLADQIEDHLRGRATLIHEPDLLDTGGGIKNALPYLGNDPFFVVSGDSIWTDGVCPALQNMMDFWNPDIMDILILLQPVESMTLTQGLGDYDLAADGKAIRSADKTGSSMWTSVRICKPEIFADTPEGPFSFLSVLDRVQAQGRLYGLIHDGDWHHISTPDDLHRVDAHMSALREAV